MTALIPGYNYDVFISYRQKDNRYDGWVSEFVTSLKKELEATLKDDISIYYDENPHDGILETHRVNQTVNNKIKCLIFIPILSQTYCDPKSFAWQHEFLPFRNMASTDQFGLDIRLANGNVASRILPVRIHDLDKEDQSLFEKESKGILRSIDFTFKSPGVNRPLRLSEDRPNDNVNKTYYRDQINKTANAIKEIMTGIGPKKFGTNHSKTGAKEKHREPDSIVENSIAVIPFVNMSNDPEQEYFCDGISEEIINTIVQLQNLKVTGRTSSFSFKGKNEDLREIGKALGVSKILEGSIRKSGNRVRITAQLVEAATGFHLWSKKYDRELHDVFAVQDEISQEIADQLKITLTGRKNKPKARKQTRNIEAYQLYFKGRSLFYQRGMAMAEAIKCFESALEIDPEYALAWAGLSDAYTMLIYHGYLSPEETWPKSIPAAHNAFKYGPELAETHNALAAIAMFHDRKWGIAEIEFKKALEINPTYTQARVWYGFFYLMLIRMKFAEGIEQTRLASENDPLSAYAHSCLAMALGQSNFLEEALKEAEYGLKLDPNAFLSHYTLAHCFQWSGRSDEAIGEFEISLRISKGHSWSLYGLILVYLKSNKMDEAFTLYNEMEKGYKEKYFLPSVLAIGAASLNKKDYALELCSQGCLFHDPYLTILALWHKDTEVLRNIPGFDKILESLGLQKPEAFMQIR